MSDKCVVNQCCCGCTLRTGAVATAIICLVSAILNVISAVFQLISDHVQLSWFNIIVYAILLIAAIFLMLGVKKENARYIRIWLYIMIVIIVIIIISTITQYTSGRDITGLLMGLITAAIEIYLMVVVRSYAIQLESGGGAGNTV